VAEAIDGLGVLVGQHKTADQRYRAAIAKGLIILRSAGVQLPCGTPRAELISFRQAAILRRSAL
jgi:hypothetical protein